MPNHEIKVLRAGDTSKPDPYTIVIVSNPVLEMGEESDDFEVDPIVEKPRKFNDCVTYINRCLFGELSGQREKFLADPSIARKIRVVSLFIEELPATDENALIYIKGQLVARSDNFLPFLANYGLVADVSFAVSASEETDAATAWATDDDDSRGGVPFEFDSRRFSHRYHYRTPGSVAMHMNNRRMTASHEFGHAASSYTNGYLTDLYVPEFNHPIEGTIIFNKKMGRPIPDKFSLYNVDAYFSDKTRDHIGYETGWRSYHPELINEDFPSLMDNYNYAAGKKYGKCEHDRLSRQFLLDRIRAKTSR
jgi:hypothetical protein